MNENKDLTTVPGSLQTLSSFRPPPGCQCAIKADAAWRICFFWALTKQQIPRAAKTKF